MLDCARNYAISNLSRHWKQRIEIWLSLWLKFATKISRMVRIVRNTGVAVRRTCSRTSAAENSVPHVELLLTNRKALTSLSTFLLIIPNIRDTKTLTWREYSTNRVFVIQIYQGATVDYIWIISLENTKAKCRHFFFVKQEIERQSTCKKRIDLVSLKTLHWFSYVANVCWIVLGIMPSAIFLDIENSESRFDFRCGSNGDKV